MGASSVLIMGGRGYQRLLDDKVNFVIRIYSSLTRICLGGLFVFFMLPHYPRRP